MPIFATVFVAVDLNDTEAILKEYDGNLANQVINLTTCLDY